MRRRLQDDLLAAMVARVLRRFCGSRRAETGWYARQVITIVDYRDTWPLEFETLATKVRVALGDRALAIHHIGSTAVPGLAAKDVIDLQVTVEHLDVLVQAELESVGFARHPTIEQDHCPPGMTLKARELEKRLYSGTGRPANLHVRASGRFNQRYPLLWRDYLRAQPMAANAYAEIKRQLAQRFPEDVASYYAVKDPVFDVIMAGAGVWAERVGWMVPASDA